ncbi:MAG: Eco57I restriction-modification methylase domain-containing protein, partial [Caldisericum sp.]|uniref:Eco57I restriction-modification methylase domain-containing protein n=1 Tax=Caldisericum sp. TaxID=2499687 RepID=UPI003D0B4CF9
MNLEAYLKNSYSRANFLYLVKEILPNFEEQTGTIELNDSQKEKVSSFSFLGKSKMNGKSVFALDVELKSNVESSPTFQRNLVAQYLQKQVVEAAIVAYHTPNEAKWKIALVTVSYKLSEKGVDKEISEAKRYYYVVGQENIHTASTQLGSIIGKQNTLEDLVNAFSVEKVTKDFFVEIANKFYELIGGKVKRGNKEEEHSKILKLPTQDPKVERIFAIKLLSRLIFLWFLKKKDLISDSVLSAKAVDNYKEMLPIELRTSNSYYHSVLEPLFFEVLNKRIEDRETIFKQNSLFKDIPFLNGGLFESRLDEDFYDSKQNDFSKRINFSVKIDDKWFKDLFKILDRYNFTVDESTPVDLEISIDPEMLGRIFENLLAEINEETQETARKLTGSYYTPRVIVDYMVTKSLKYYFLNKTKLQEKIIDNLLSYQSEEIDLTDDDKLQIIDAIDELKVIDPACGSGAFPMGLLQKLLLVLRKVDPDNKLWLEKKLSKIDDPTLREKTKEKWSEEREEENYLRKLGILRDSIFGIDIQPIAIEISRLRSFLTLVVDIKVDKSKHNSGVEPLPNLDFKFVIADSLIDVEKAEKINETDETKLIKDTYFDDLKELTNNYFYASDRKKKEDLRGKIEKLIDKKVNEKLEEIKYRTKSLDGRMRKTTATQDKIINDLNYQMELWDSYKNIFLDKPVKFFNVKYFFPSAKDGFDIVIANPPYVRQEKIKDQKENLAKQGYFVFNSTSDLYTYFYEKGYDLLKDGGILTFISSNKWMRAKYGEKLRKFLKEKTILKEIIDFGGYKVFEATVDTNIVVFEKKPSANVNEFFYLNVSDDFDGKDLYGYFNRNASVMSQEDLSDSAWTLADDKVLALKKKIESIGKPLKDWDVKIYRGVLTGFNEAFIIDTETRDKILANCKTDEERKRTEEIIKPVLRGRDIEKYYYKWAGLWVILAKFGFYKEAHFYPALVEHLLRYEKQLKNRGQCRYTR